MNKLEISEIQIIPIIKPQNGLVAFSSVVLNQSIYCGNIAIYTSPGAKLGYRLVFPNRKLGSGRVVECFHPITQEAGTLISEAIIKKYVELMDNFHHVEAA